MTNDHGCCPHCGVELNGGSIWQHFYDRAINEKALTETQAEQEADVVAAMYEEYAENYPYEDEIAVVALNNINKLSTKE